MRGTTLPMEVRQATWLTSAKAKNTFRCGNAEQRHHSRRGRIRRKENKGEIQQCWCPPQSWISSELLLIHIISFSYFTSSSKNNTAAAKIHWQIHPAVSLSLSTYSAFLPFALSLSPAHCGTSPPPLWLLKHFGGPCTTKTPSASLWQSVSLTLCLEAALSYVHLWVSIDSMLAWSALAFSLARSCKQWAERSQLTAAALPLVSEWVQCLQKTQTNMDTFKNGDTSTDTTMCLPPFILNKTALIELSHSEIIQKVL